MQQPPGGMGASGRVYAALDLGTNNCRLLIASPRDGDVRGGAVLVPSLKILDSFSRIVRLGEGVSATGRLSDEAMQRTRAALIACQKKLQRYHIHKARFVATEACRRAGNGPAFLEHIRQQIGLPIEIISNEQEAHLAFLGCASLLAADAERAMVFDIGGGSTEVMWVDMTSQERRNGVQPISDWLSIGYGVMNLADKFGGSTLADMAFDDMVAFIIEQLRPFDEANQARETIAKSKVQLLSTSGTVTTLAAIHLGLPRYDRAHIDGITLNISDLQETTRRLLAMRPSERFNHPCIGPDRADFIISGCAIFEAIANFWKTGSVTIADRGVREGIILSLLDHG